MNGNVVHTWEVVPFFNKRSRLLPNGNLVYVGPVSRGYNIHKESLGGPWGAWGSEFPLLFPLFPLLFPLLNPAASGMRCWQGRQIVQPSKGLDDSLP